MNRQTMNDPVFHISTDRDINTMIAQASRLEMPWRVELYRAVRDKMINLAGPGRDADAPRKLLEASPRPTVVLLGDDDYASTGPDGWMAFRCLGYWARAAMMHATGGDVASYQLAVGLTCIKRRLLLIETSSERAHEWGRALQRRRIPAVGLVPPGDNTHPVQPARGDLQ